MSERENINAIKQRCGQDLGQFYRDYLNLSERVQADAKFHSPHLAQDSANLARYDLAYAEIKIEKGQGTDAVIMFNDGEERIQQAAKKGADMSDLQKEADKIKLLLPPCEIGK